MSEKFFQKSLKNLEKPSVVGFSRFQALEILLSAGRPLTVGDICTRMTESGCYIHRDTVTVILNEINAGLTSYTLNSVIVHSGQRSRARAYYLTLKKKKKHELVNQPYGRR